MERVGGQSLVRAGIPNRLVSLQGRKEVAGRQRNSETTKPRSALHSWLQHIG